MSHCYTFANCSVASARDAVESQIDIKKARSHAEISWQDNEVRVRVSRVGGTSEFRYQFSAVGADVHVSEAKRSVSWLHRLHVGRVKAFIDEMMLGAGAVAAG